MADEKISQLDPVTDVLDDDDYVLARAGASKRITGASLKADLGGSLPAQWTVDADGNLTITPTGAGQHIDIKGQDGLTRFRVSDGEVDIRDVDGNNLMLITVSATQGQVAFFDDSGNVALILDGTGVALSGATGFYGTTPVAQQTGVAVSAAAIHAALVNLGLITT